MKVRIVLSALELNKLVPSGDLSAVKILELSEVLETYHCADLK